MNDAIVVFLSGVTGVACGMTLLYVSIKITGIVTDFMLKSKETDHA